MNKVLFIAYYFPPIGGGGVQRSAKFVKYLSQFGWQPYVISTTETIDVEGFDDSLLAGVPRNTPVWRVPTPNPAPITRFDDWNSRHLKRWLRANSAQARNATGSYESNSPTEATSSESRNSHNLLKAIRRFALFPLQLMEEPPIDRYLYWSLHIVPLALKIIRQHQIDLIYTTCPPWSVNLTGLLLKQLSGRPWVADFRDPWTKAVIYQEKGWRALIDHSFERRTMHNADMSVFVNSAIAQEFGQGYTIIENGYDSSDFPSDSSNRANVSHEHIGIVHLGTIYFDTIQPLVSALSTILEFPPEERSKVKFVQIGWIDSREEKKVEALREAGLMELVSRTEKAQAMAEMRNADVLVLLLGKGIAWSQAHRGKLFEYMYSGKPILAIAPEGVAADLVKESGTGCVIHPDDVGELTAVLREIAFDYGSFKKKYYHPCHDVIQRYDRRLLTKRLAQVFDNVLADER